MEARLRPRKVATSTRCSTIAEATRKQFYGDGETPYTPSKGSPNF